MWNRFVTFWESDLWEFRLDEISGWRRNGYQFLRVISLSIARFQKDSCTLRASALTYYTLMSIVPILALAFSIARGFNLHESLKADLFIKFQGNQAAFHEMVLFADRLVDQTSGGLIAGIGVAVLIWSAISLIGSMESALNDIWGVEKMRSWRRIIGEYTALLLIAPILFVVSNSIAVFVATYFETLFTTLPFSKFFIAFLHLFAKLVTYAFFSIFFMFFYYFLPNTKVFASSAFVGGAVAGLSYLVAQWGYLYFQIGASRLGAIYGSFAALPLFLVWLQVSWFIFLFCAEICCCYQTIDRYEFKTTLEKASPKLKKMLSLWILQVTIRHFQETSTPISVHTMINQCHIPLGLSLCLIEQLVDCGLLVEVKAGESLFLPGRPLENLRIFDVLDALDSKGVSDLPFIRSEEFGSFALALKAFTDVVEKSPNNQLLSALITPK